MIKAGVIGWPIEHSLSPRLHGYWLKQYNIEGSYERYAVPESELGDFITSLHSKGFKGVNVTLPHKEEVIPCLQELTPTAKRIGAVNTILVREDGSLQGDSTDGIGFINPLLALGDKWNKDRPAVVLGAGGAARAVVDVLREQGVSEIRVINRDQLKARLLGEDLLLYKWREAGEALQGAGLLVNSTPLGMKGKPFVDVPLEQLPLDAVVYDLIYNPYETRLLQQAGDRPKLNGLDMLLHQAAPGFARWFGVTPEVTPELKFHVLAGLA